MIGADMAGRDGGMSGKTLLLALRLLGPLPPTSSNLNASCDYDRMPPLAQQLLGGNPQANTQKLIRERKRKVEALRTASVAACRASEDMAVRLDEHVAAVTTGVAEVADFEVHIAKTKTVIGNLKERTTSALGSPELSAFLRNPRVMHVAAGRLPDDVAQDILTFCAAYLDTQAPDMTTIACSQPVSEDLVDHAATQVPHSALRVKLEGEIQSLEQTRQLLEQTIQSREQTIQSLEETTQSLEETTQSLEQTIQSREQAIQSLEQTTQSLSRQSSHASRRSSQSRRLISHLNRRSSHASGLSRVYKLTWLPSRPWRHPSRRLPRSGTRPWPRSKGRSSPRPPSTVSKPTWLQPWVWFRPCGIS